MGTNNNVAVGYNALFNQSSGSGSNVAVGALALNNVTSGGLNTAIGEASGGTDSSGSDNTFVGAKSNISSGTFTNATAIGYATIATASNTMEFGNHNVIGWGFGAAVPTDSAVFIVGTSSANGNGAYLSHGGVWTNTSTREKKQDFTPLNEKEVLNKIGMLQVTRWRYIGTNEYHIGPVAEDFYSAFGVGVNNKSISTIDPSGVALLGIQALKKENEDLKKMVEELSRRIEVLEKK
jgi:hypothetical protein